MTELKTIGFAALCVVAGFLIALVFFAPTPTTAQASCSLDQPTLEKLYSGIFHRPLDQGALGYVGYDVSFVLDQLAVSQEHEVYTALFSAAKALENRHRESDTIASTDFELYKDYLDSALSIVSEWAKTLPTQSRSDAAVGPVQAREAIQSAYTGINTTAQQAAQRGLFQAQEVIGEPTNLALPSGYGSDTTSPDQVEYSFPPPIPQQPDTSKDGPWNRDLLKAESRDGITFGASSIFVVTAGVPSVTKDVQGRLVAAFQWFPENNTEHFDQVAIAISEDNGATWASPQPMKIANFPQGYQRPFDPTVVILSNGKIRMYFTSHASGQTKPSIYSAISDDGINYIFEDGQRFGVSNETVLDSAVGFLNGTWHMINPYNIQGVMGTGYHASSADGLSFTRQANLSFSQTVSWIGNLIGFGSGLRFYGSASPQIWWTFTQDGTSWGQPNMTNITGGDPAVVKLSEVRYLMIYVGPPKEPLPSAQQPPG